MRRLTLLTSMLVAVAPTMPTSGGEPPREGRDGPQVFTAARGRHPLALAIRRARLIVRLVATRSAATPEHVDPAEHQRAWSEHSRAAERFHEIVLESHPAHRSGS